MEYSKLLNRAFMIVWEHKFLIVLGALVALGSCMPGNQVSWRTDGAGDGNFDFGQLPNIEREIFRQFALPALIVVIGILLVIALMIWAIALVARGSLIVGVDAIERGEVSSFALAWSAGWPRVVRLIGIGLVPGIPLLILLMTGLIAAGLLAGFLTLFNLDLGTPAAIGWGTAALVMACIAAPVALVLSLLRIFAERACMLEGLGVMDSYRRGLTVVWTNLGNALPLFIIQIAISIGLGIVLFVPGIVMALCFLLWPVLLLMQGAIAAYFSTMWTLAWHAWTDVGVVSEMGKGAILAT